MRKELRGRKSNDYTLGKLLNIEQTFEAYQTNGASTDLIHQFDEEYAISISACNRKGALKNMIRTRILELYNDDITPTYMYLHYYVDWYAECLRMLERMGYDDKNIITDFDKALKKSVLIDIKDLLKKSYDKNDAKESIRHLQYRILSYTKSRIIEVDDAIRFDVLRHDIETVIENASFLGLCGIDKDNVNYLLQWEYYPVDRIFKNIINTFNSEISKDAYSDLNGKEYHYFNLIKKAAVDFKSIKVRNIVKEGKSRTVFTAHKPIDQATLIYLSKRLNLEFKISYPNRDKIMEQSFNLIDSLPGLDDYTIYKFDFKDFFESVKIAMVYQQYIEHSNLYTYEKDLIAKIMKKYKCCVQGLPISNALIEIIANDFDGRIKAVFAERGLIFYKRYVDDCILIFNHREEEKDLSSDVEACIDAVFGKRVKISPSKTAYQTKRGGSDRFDYLGYSFTRCARGTAPKLEYYYKFGIADKKIEKYKMQLDAIFDAYQKDGNEKLLLRRIQYYNSRVVFYNYTGSKYANKSTWDVRGITNSYRMLRPYLIFQSQKESINATREMKNAPCKIESDTLVFLRNYIRDKRNSLTVVPFYLRGKGCNDHSLWEGFLNNRSIVFQPNIGWGNDLLNSRLMELGIRTAHKSYYEKTRDYYTALIKKL